MTRRQIVGSSLIFALAGCLAVGQTQTVPRGEVQTVTVHGASLEGNLLGVSADRAVTVYLPPGYEGSASRYPVVYLLHALGGSDIIFAALVQSNRHIPDQADALIGEGTIQPLILVMPDASTPYGACFYANSPVCGNWDDFLTRELVTTIDQRFRTLARPESRAVAGVHVGGYGALLLAMEHPDVFGAAYAMTPLNAALTDQASNDYYSPDAFFLSEPDRALGLTPGSNAGKVQLGMAAIASPDPANPPYYVELPVEIVDGLPRPRDAVWESWVAHTPLAMLGAYASNLRQLRALGIDVGTDDIDGNALLNARAFDTALTDAGIAHRFEVYQGVFFDAVSERLASTVLPFLSAALEPEAPPSSSR